MLRRPTIPGAATGDEPSQRNGGNVKELEPTIDPNLYQNKKDRAAEIVYEVTTQQNRLPFGVAIVSGRLWVE
jgi:hypothetical protein